MSSISNHLAIREREALQPEGNQRAAVWGEALKALVDPSYGMDDSQRAGYEQKIIQKLKTGRKLSSEELEYLRIHNPELYRTAMRVETARKALRAKLRNCQSKEEARQVISGQMEVLKAMKDDPDFEYLSAMVQKEVMDFQKSSAYARLPQTEEEGKKRTKKESPLNALGEEEQEREYQKIATFGRMQFQCEMIAQMAQGVAALSGTATESNTPQQAI